MESQNNRGDKFPTRHLSPPDETFTSGNGLHLIELLTKELHGNHQISQAIAKAIGRSLKTGSKALLLKTNLHISTEHRNIKLVPYWSLHPTSY